MNFQTLLPGAVHANSTSKGHLECLRPNAYGTKMQPQSAQKRCAETVHNHNCGSYFDALLSLGVSPPPLGPPWWPQGPKNSILNDLGSSWENPGETQNRPKCVPGAPLGGILEEKVESRKRGSRVDASILLRLGGPPGTLKRTPLDAFYSVLAPA